jgi:drug/metabolite transporter (DMT)-like permease
MSAASFRNSLSLILCVSRILAVTFLREKLNKLQLLGVGFAVAAILLLFMRDVMLPVVMAIRSGASVVGYSRAISKIGYEPHLRLRRSSLGIRWIHAFAAGAVSRQLHFQVFNEQLGLGPA